MSRPQDRTKAVIDTRRILEALEASEQPLMWDLVRTVAMNALRNYPTEADIAASAVALPSLWGTPSPSQDNGAGILCHPKICSGRCQLLSIVPKTKEVNR
jgi:hypothetical protein